MSAAAALSVVLSALTAVLLLSGVAFFTAGTLGLLRLPDTRTRLHALTKADNVGLGLILAGIALSLRSPAAAVLLALVWVLALIAASVSARLLGGLEAQEEGDPP